MPTTVTMPQLGETVVEGTIIKWLKSEGEEIGRDEPLFEISTDKVDTEVPSPVAGTISKILVPEGETVSVGTELAEIDDGSAGKQTAEVPSEVPQAEAEPEEAEEAEEERREQPEAPQQAPQEEEPAEEKPEPDRQEQAQPAGRQGSEGDGQRAAVAAPSGGGPRSHILSPLVRRLAEEHDIDLSEGQGSGTGGGGTKKGILGFVGSPGAA